MTNKTQTQRASLKRRIRQFYDLLNLGDFHRCYEMIDPRIRRKPSSVTLFQYENSLRQFLEHHRQLKVLEVSIDLHLDEPSELYEGRDFAVGHTAWQDKTGEQHVLSERWVREGRSWYSRCTGFVASQPAKTTVPLAQSKDRSSVARRERTKNVNLD